MFWILVTLSITFINSIKNDIIIPTPCALDKRYCDLCNNFNISIFLSLLNIAPPVPVPIPYSIDKHTQFLLDLFGLDHPILTNKTDCMQYDKLIDLPNELLGDIKFKRCYLKIRENGSNKTKEFCFSMMEDFIVDYKYQDMEDALRKGQKSFFSDLSMLIGNNASFCYGKLMDDNKQYEMTDFDCKNNYLKGNIFYIIISIIIIFI